MPKLRGGLYRNPGGRFWLYHFRWKGEPYKGSTGKEDRPSAERWLRAFRDSLADAAVGIASQVDPLLKDLWTEWLKVHKPPATSERHRERVSRDWRLHILPVFGDEPASRVTAKDVELFRADYLSEKSLRKTDKPRTNRSANRLVAHLRLVLGWAWKTQRISAHPFTLTPLPELETVRHFLRVDQVDPFLEALDRITQAGMARKLGENPNNRPADALHVRIAVRAMLFMLLREDEALSMRWSGFSGEFRSYTPWDTKGGEATALPVPDDLQALLKIAKERCPDGCPWVLPGDDGEPHRGQFTRKAIKAAGEEIGVHGLTPHRMRGTGATLLARANQNAFLIQKAGRWKDIKTATAYVQLVEDDLRAGLDKAFRRLPPSPQENPETHTSGNKS